MTVTCSLTYEGPMASGRQKLPGRTVAFKRGQTIDFTVDELVHLDPSTWIGDRPDVGALAFAPSDGGRAVIVKVGTPLPSIPEVLAVATTPERATALLEAEISTKNRKTLVAELTQLAGTDPTVTPED